MNARAWLVLLALAGLAPSAYADKAKAEQYFHAGAEAFKKQSFEAASEQFELAYKELALPEIAFRRRRPTGASTSSIRSRRT